MPSHILQSCMHINFISGIDSFEDNANVYYCYRCFSACLLKGRMSVLKLGEMQQRLSSPMNSLRASFSDTSLFHSWYQNQTPWWGTPISFWMNMWGLACTQINAAAYNIILMCHCLIQDFYINRWDFLIAPKEERIHPNLSSMLVWVKPWSLVALMKLCFWKEEDAMCGAKEIWDLIGSQ